MECQIKNLSERFEHRILTYLEKDCPEFTVTYDEKTLYEPSQCICHDMNNIIKVIFNEIYYCMRDGVRDEIHGLSLDKINFHIKCDSARSNAGYELSVGAQ